MKYIKRVFKYLASRFSWIFVLIGYFIINLTFYSNVYWSQLINDLSKKGAVYGEVQVYEWALDRFYHILISGNNPFGSMTAILYPFGLNFSLLDLGYGLFFPLLRPFLSIHQTVSVMVVTFVLLANFGMYIFLRKLNLNKILSFIIGAAFGSMTFLMPRDGHLSYWCHFIFPWFYYCVLVFFLNKKFYTKLLAILASSLLFTLILWMNFYYFIMLLISIFFLLLYFLIFKTKLFFDNLKRYWRWILLQSFLILLLLIPWLGGVRDFFIFDSVPKTQGWGGAIQFSSDLFNYIIPSGYGYFVSNFPFLYKPFTLFLQLFSPDARSIFESFTYPGIIILLSYFFFAFFFKKINKSTRNKIWPFLFTSIIFFILTLGPFLHVFGHWTLTVDEGIKIVIPLPYIVLHYIPFLNNIRVPGRLIVGFIFFAYVVSAFIIDNFLERKSDRFKKIFLLILFLVFVVDQRVNNKILPAPQIYPYKIYKSIQADKEKATVLEIPFTVRDGFTYFGDGNAIGMTVGQSIHEKSLIGGYIGRISDYKKNYYINDPFIGYIGRLIDENILNNPSANIEDLINWQKIDIENSKNTIDFLNIKYIINNDERPYTASISAIFQDLGFQKKLIDGKFSLWKRELSKKEYLNINMSKPFDKLYLGFGWHDIENNFRWTEGRNSVMFKIQEPKKYNLNFTAAAFNKGQTVTIYLNKKEIAKVNISMEMKDYLVPIDQVFVPKLNTMHFIFDKYYLPSEIIPGSLDKRRISAKFSKIWLTE